MMHVRTGRRYFLICKKLSPRARHMNELMDVGVHTLPASFVGRNELVVGTLFIGVEREVREGNSTGVVHVGFFRYLLFL